MILYATTKTFLAYRLKTAADLAYPRSEIARGFLELEQGDSLLEWGMKVFQLEDRRCLQIVNLGTGLQIYLFGVERRETGLIGRALQYYICELYREDEEMSRCLSELFGRVKVVLFEHLTDEDLIASMERREQEFIFGGWLEKCVEGGTLDIKKLNRLANFEFEPEAGKRFRDAVIMRFRSVEESSGE